MQNGCFSCTVLCCSVDNGRIPVHNNSLPKGIETLFMGNSEAIYHDSICFHFSEYEPTTFPLHKEIGYSPSC